MDRRKILLNISTNKCCFLPVYSLASGCTYSPCFVLQLAFTMVWMTIISQLGYYKILYGPQVLLQMNIAYFLPSIPLLGLSSQFDEKLDQKFGKHPC